MKNLIAVFFLFLVTNISFAQTIQWERNYGGEMIEEFYTVLETEDGAFLLGGASNSIDNGMNNFGNSDAWLVKIDSAGNQLWEQNYGGSDLDRIETIVATEDGYLLAGLSASQDNDVEHPIGEIDYWVIKITEEGILEWEKSLGGMFNDFFASAIRTSDGGYLVGGHGEITDATPGETFGDIDIVIYKISATGEIEWEKNYHQSDFDRLAKILPTPDGGYLLGGNSPNEEGYHDFWVLKIDANGALQTERNYGGSASDFLADCIPTLDGGYLLGGTTRSTDGDAQSQSIGFDDYWVVKINAEGEIEWEKKYGNANTDNLKSLAPTDDGGVLLGGSSDNDYWVVKIDENGNEEWSNNYGLPDTDQFEMAIRTNDGGFILGGSGTIAIDGFEVDQDFLIYKICDDLNTTSCDQTNSIYSINNLSSISNIQLVPNPATDNTLIQFESERSEQFPIMLYDVYGRLLDRFEIRSTIGTNSYDLDVSAYSKGIYFIRFGGELKISKKLIKQ